MSKPADHVGLLLTTGLDGNFRKESLSALSRMDMNRRNCSPDSVRSP